MSRFFNASSGPDFITIPTSASINSLAPKFTVMAWILFPGTNLQFFPIIMAFGNGSTSRVSFYLNAASGSPELYIDGFWPGGTGPSSHSSVIMTPNVWTHVAYTYDDGGDRLARIYINGVEVTYDVHSPASGSAISAAISGLPITIGWDKSVSFWTGNLAEIQIYRTILSPSQIQTAASGVVPQMPGGIVTYLRLAGTQSPEPDASNNGNAGILTGTMFSSATPALPPQLIVPFISVSASLGSPLITPGWPLVTVPASNPLAGAPASQTPDQTDKIQANRIQSAFLQAGESNSRLN